MLRGNSKATAHAIAGKLGIDEVIAKVLPDQKIDVVERLQSERRYIERADPSYMKVIGFGPFMSAWFRDTTHLP
jgi:hypothetical protein